MKRFLIGRNNRYYTVDKLGEGGFGDVYSGWDS